MGNYLAGEKCFEGCGTFIVEALEVRSEAGCDKACMDDFERVEDAGAGTIAHRFHEDTVAIAIVHDKNVIVAGTGSDKELARLIGMYLTSIWIKHSSIAMVRAVIGGIAGWKVETALLVDVVTGRLAVRFG